MPHSLFLGSALATQDRISTKHHNAFAPSPSSSTPSVASSNSSIADGDGDDDASNKTSPTPTPRMTRKTFKQRLRAIPSEALESVLTAFRVPPPSTFATRVNRHCDRDNNSLKFVTAHVYHGVVDVAVSLLGFAVVINSL